MDGRRVSLALVLAFLGWTVAVAAGLLDAADAALAELFLDARNEATWTVVTSLGDRPAMAVWVLAAVVVGAVRRDWLGAGLAGALPLAAWGVGTLLKEIVDRPRPDWALVVEDSPTYPSNHALVGWVLWVCVSFVLARHHPLRARIAAAGAVPAVLVALSRLALGVHHVSDVVGSWFLGLALLAALPGFTAWLDARWRRLRGTTRPAPDAG